MTDDMGRKPIPKGHRACRFPAWRQTGERKMSGLDVIGSRQTRELFNVFNRHIQILMMRVDSKRKDGFLYFFIDECQRCDRAFSCGEAAGEIDMTLRRRVVGSAGSDFKTTLPVFDLDVRFALAIHE